MCIIFPNFFPSQINIFSRKKKTTTTITTTTECRLKSGSLPYASAFYVTMVIKVGLVVWKVINVFIPAHLLGLQQLSPERFSSPVSHLTNPSAPTYRRLSRRLLTNSMTQYVCVLRLQIRNYDQTHTEQFRTHIKTHFFRQTCSPTINL